MVKKNNLSSHILQNVLSETNLHNNFTNEEAENIQIQLSELLCTVILKYTRNESSSIPAETAKTLTGSVIYTIDNYLERNNFLNIYSLLKETKLSDIFEEGKSIIQAKIKHSKTLLHLAQSRSLSAGSIAYNHTLFEGLDKFNEYDTDFHAQSFPCDIDYQLYFDIPDLSGIDYVYDYIKNMFLENIFFAYFETKSIKKLLSSYSTDFNKLLDNIFERVLINALGCILCNKYLKGLELNTMDIDYLYENLHSLSSSEIDEKISQAFITLFNELNITNIPLKKYLLKSQKKFAFSLKENINNKSLNNYFVAFKDNTQDEIYFDSNAKMGNSLFRKLVEEIALCDCTYDKIKLIKENITSIRDLTDIFDCDCIEDNEFPEILKSFTSTELKIIYQFLMNRFDNPMVLDTDDLKTWQKVLIQVRGQE